MAEDIEEPQVSEDPFAKYGGKAIEKSEDPFAKYGGKSIGTQSKTEQVGGLTAYSDSRQKTTPTEEIKRPAKLTDYTSVPLEMVSKAKATEVSRKPSTQPVRKIATEEKAAAEGTRTNLQLPTTLKGGQFGIVAEPQQEGELQQKLQQRAEESKAGIDNTITERLKAKGIPINPTNFRKEQLSVQDQIDNGELSMVKKDGIPMYGRVPAVAESFAKGVIGSAMQFLNGLELGVAGNDNLKKADILENQSKSSEAVANSEIGLGDLLKMFYNPSQVPIDIAEKTIKSGNQNIPIGRNVASDISGTLGGLSTLALTSSLGLVGIATQSVVSAVGDKAQQIYQTRKQEYLQQGLSETQAKSQAAADATEFAPAAALPDAFLNAALMTQVPNALTPAAVGFKDAIVNTLKGATKMGFYGMGTEAAVQGIEAAQGQKPEDVLKKIIEKGGDFFLMDAAMHGLPLLAKGGIGMSKNLASSLKEYLTQEKIKPQVEAAISQMDNGAQVQQELNDYETTRNKIKGLVPEEHIAAYTNNLQEQQKINNQIIEEQSKKASLPEALHSEIDKNIDSLNSQLEQLNKQLVEFKKSGNPVEHEFDDATGQPIIHLETKPIVETIPTIEPTDNIKVGEMLDKTGTYKGVKGSFTQEGQTVIFKEEGKDRVHEIGNIDEVKDMPISDFDIKHEESIVSVDNDGNFNVINEVFVNPFEQRGKNPTDAILYDKDGNVVNVRMKTADGKRRTFKGNIAEDLAYQIHLKEINKNNETRAAFEQHINEDTEAQNEINNAGLPKNTDGGTIEGTEQVPQQEVVQPKAKVVKVKVKPIEVVSETAPKEEKTAADTVHDDLLTHLGIKEEPKGETKPAKKYTSKNIDTISEEGLNDTQKKVVKDVKNVVKAVSKLVEKTTGNPLEVNIHETPSSYEKAVIDAGGTKQDSTTKGFYLDADGTIHLNMERVTTDTMLHEGFHPVLDYMAKNRPDIIDNLHTQLEGLKGGKEVIDNANKLYEGSDATTIKKEAITDFIAKVADRTIKIDKTNFQKVKDFFVNAVNKLGFKLGKDINTITDLKKLAELVSEKFNKGEEIKVMQKNFIPIDNRGESGDAIGGGKLTVSDISKAKVGDTNPLQLSKNEEKNDKFKEVNLVKLPVVSLEEKAKEFNNKAVAINSDPTKVGKLTFESGKEIFMYGGLNYTALEPNVKNEIGFASTNLGKPKQVQGLMKSLFPERDGSGLILTTSQKPESMLGNAYSLEYTLDAISKLPKSILKSSEFKNEFFGKDIVAVKNAFGEKKYDAFVNKYSKSDLGNPDVIADMIKNLLTDIGNNFVARNSLVDNMLAGITSKESRADTKGELGYVSKDPKKYIAKNLFDRFGLNQEVLFYKIGEKGIVDAYMKEGKWGFVTGGFESDSKVDYNSIQEKGIIHPQFNSKFHGKNPFILDGAYMIDKLWTPQVNTHDAKGNPYIEKKTGLPTTYEKKASLMVAGSMYPKGEIETPSKEFEKAIPQFSKEKNENEDIVSASVNVAPLYSTRVDSPEQAALLQNSEFYKEFKNKNEKLAGYFNLKVDNQKDGIGGFAGVSEVTTVVNVTGKFEDIVKYAAINGSLTPEVQESTIAGMYVKKNSKYHNADKIEVGINDMKAAMRAVKDAGFDENGYTLLNDEISFFNIHEFKIDGFEEKINIFESKYKEYGGQITREDNHAVRSEYIDAERRKAIISKIDGEGLQREQDRTGLRNELENAKERNENFLNWKKINESDAAIEYRDLRQKQLELADKGESLSDKDDARIKELEGKLSEPLASIISSDKKQYEKAKKEIDTIANDVASLVAGGFKSEFGIKRPSRAAVKVVRWYDVQPNLLADGARANVIVNTNADADFLFNEIKRRFNSTLNRNEGETTNLGYPKRLIELRTKSGKIAEIQVMTPQGYLAKDGISHFPEDAKSKAKESLKEVRNKLGWDIPDGVGHYFYEIHRDPNVPKSLKIQAEELSNKYYKAFLDSESKLTDSEFRKDITSFKDKVDAANKSKWDNGNEGKSPKTLDKYLEQPILENKQQFSKGDQYSKIKDFIEIQRQKGISDKDIQAGLEKASEKIWIDKAKIDELMSTPKVEQTGDLQSQYDGIKSEKAKKKFITKNFGEVSEEQLSDIVKNNTDLQTIKDKIDAIQKSGAGEVLQRKQEGNGDGQRVGISHKSLTELADKLGLEQPERGDVLTPEEYSERGKLLIKNGADPIKAAEEFKKDNKVNSDIISVARAHFNELVRDVNDARIKFGIDSEEYKKSLKEANDWAKNVVKPMGTAFYEIGSSLQGQVDLDTGNFVSVSMAVQEKTGKDLSTEQTKEVERLTTNVSDLNKKIQDLEKKLTDTISKGEEAKPKAKEGIKEKSKEIANVIRKGKLSKPDIFSSASPASLVWDAAIEITAKTVEVSGDIAQAIADGLEHIKNSDWYKNSDSDKQKAAQKAFRDFVQNQDIKIRFAEKKDNKFTTEEAKYIWEYAKEEYLDKGSDYREMLNGVSKDLGLNRDQVRTAISQPKGAKEITDEMYRNINKRNSAINEAKQWVEEQGNSKTKNFLKAVPSAFFKLKTFGHGTVGGITHAGTNIFQISKWKSYFPFFAKQFKYAFGDTAKYEMAMEDLKNDPQFTFWQRAGLAVDPKVKYDDYQGNFVDGDKKVNGIKKLFDRLGVAGDRGFNALKVYRLDLAKGFYDRLSNEEKADPNTAKEIAKLVNHSTGTSELDLGRGGVSKFVSTAFFAPKLEASRWQGLIGDPAKAAKTFTNWKEASPAEKAGAKLVARNAGEKIATYVALLAANSALLSLMGSKQKINYTNPLGNDWLKFKTGGGKTLDITGGTLASMRLLGTLLDNTVTGYTGNKKELWKKPAEKDYQAIGTQIRYKLSPFASTIADLVETTDAMGRPLPYSNIKPKKGETQYTVGSYLLQQQTPIPISAGIREAIGSMKERGMTNIQIQDALMGTLYFTVEGFTGAKLGNEPKKKK